MLYFSNEWFSPPKSFMSHNIKRLQQYIPQLPPELLEVMTPRDDIDPNAQQADSVGYDNDTSLLNATNVQGAIDEVENRVDNIEEIIAGGLSGAVGSVFGRTGNVIAVSGDYTSTLVTNSSGVSGATVSDALNVLDSGKSDSAHTHTAGSIIFVANGDITSIDVQSAIVELRNDTDTKLASKAATTDPRFTDARTPTLHAMSHVSGADIIQSATAAQNGLMTSVYAGKLDNIEAFADVTGATNVAAAGAVMTPVGVTNGDIIIRSSGAWNRLAIGSTSQVLKVSGGLPVWATPALSVSTVSA